jgi:hypothetical protein
MLVQAGPPNTCACYILAEEAERFQSESRTISVLSGLGCQAAMDWIQLIQADDSLTFGASPDHILAKNTVKEVAVRCINSAFQGCN